MPVSLDAAKPGFDIEQGRGHPSLLLIAISPAIHVVRSLPHLGHQGFQAVGGLQGKSQLRKYPQPVQGEGLLHPLVQAGDGRDIEQTQLLPATEQSGMGLRIRRPFVGPLQLPSPEGLLGLRKVAYDVLPFVPLAALEDSLGSKDLLDGLMKALGPIESIPFLVEIGQRTPSWD